MLLRHCARRRGRLLLPQTPSPAPPPLNNIRRRGLASSTSTSTNTTTNNESPTLLVTRTPVEGGAPGAVVATLAMNRPKARNALSRALVAELHAALNSLRHDRGVRAVVVKSSDPATFCAGADLKERAGMGEGEVDAFVHDLRGLMSGLESLPMPTVAVLEGGAFGGGLELALACDIRLAGAKAQMGLTETSLAIIPGAGGTQRLPRLIGLARAKELVFRARRFGAEEALRLGVVHSVHATPEALEEECRAVCGDIAANGPVAVRMAKAAMQQGIQADMQTGLEVERLCYAQVIPTQDRLEGLRAFKEKRKPVYIGK